MTRIALVTDSSSDLTREIYQENGITVVPLTVHFGDESFIDTVEISSSEFFDKLKRSQVMPKTSQPSPADFVAVYQRLLLLEAELLSISRQHHAITPTVPGVVKLLVRIAHNPGDAHGIGPVLLHFPSGRGCPGGGEFPVGGLGAAEGRRVGMAFNGHLIGQVSRVFGDDADDFFCLFRWFGAAQIEHGAPFRIHDLNPDAPFNDVDINLILVILEFFIDGLFQLAGNVLFRFPDLFLHARLDRPLLFPEQTFLFVH